MAFAALIKFLQILWVFCLTHTVFSQREFNFEIALHVTTAIGDFLGEVAFSATVPLGNCYSENAPAIIDRVSFSRSQMYAYMRVYHNRSGSDTFYFALESNGGFSAYAFDISAPNELIYASTDPSNYYQTDSLKLYYYNVNGNGEPIDYLQNKYGHFNVSFDPRHRPWYIPVKSTLESSWSPPYIDSYSGYPAVTLARPIINITYAGGDGAFVGALATDLLVTALNEFLIETYRQTNKIVYIVDRPTGYLIGNSFGVPNFSEDDDGNKNLLEAAASSNSVIAGSTQLMIELNWTKYLTIYKEYYIQAVEYEDSIKGLAWNVVILMPATLYPDSLVAGNSWYDAVVAIASLTLLINIMALFGIVYFWRTRTIQLTQPIFTLLVLLGGIVLSVLCFLLVGNNTNALCFLRPYLFNLCFTWCLATLLIKGWAVNTKFNAMTFEEFEKTELISVPKLFGLLMAFILCDLVIMWICLYAVGGPHGKGTIPATYTLLGENGAYSTVTACAYVSNSSLRSVEIAYKTGIVFFSCMFGYMNRKIPGLIAGSRQLLLLVYNTALTSMIVVVVTDTFSEVNLIIFAQAMGICFCVCVNSLMLVVPYIYMLLNVGDEGAAAGVRSALKGGKHAEKLKSLPIHHAIISGYRKELILKAVATSFDTIYDRVDDKTAMDMALAYAVDVEVMMELAPYFLPYESETLEPIDASVHGFGWAALTQSDHYTEVVKQLIHTHSNMCFLLAEAEDAAGRVVINIASPTCREIISKATYFLRRFQLTTSASTPHYKSSTTMVHMGIDHDSLQKNKVALKFLLHQTDYEREITTRHKAGFGSSFVIDIIEHMSCCGNEEDEGTESMRQEFDKHGFGNYRFCIIMHAGVRSLMDALISETTTAESNKDVLKFSALQLMRALDHIHSKGYIHGDVKPQNIVRARDAWAMIDLDSAAPIGSGISGHKIHSAYAPPELIFVDEQGNAVVKVAHLDSSDSNSAYDCVPAHPSHDCWALGTVLFRMASGEPLFLANNADEIDSSQLSYLAMEDGDWLSAKLDKIQDVLARNMVSQMLMFDPVKRPAMNQLMQHPFLTGSSTVARLIGQEAEFDVFISYRVASDAHHAELLWNKLTARGLKVWWDKKCLKAGEDWESGFCDGLVNSKVFVALLSQGAINHPTRANQCFAKLTATSPCDNVLLEHRLALCLNQRGLLNKVYPLMIGEVMVGEPEKYAQYSFPDLSAVKSVVVASVEKKIRDHLSRACLGTPLRPNMPVKEAMDSLTRNQGHFIVGDREATFDQAAQNIVDMVKATATINKSNKGLRISSKTAAPSPLGINGHFEKKGSALNSPRSQSRQQTTVGGRGNNGKLKAGHTGLVPSPRDFREVYDVETGRFVWTSMAAASMDQSADDVAVARNRMKENLNEEFKC